MPKHDRTFTRRGFIKTSAAAGAGLCRSARSSPPRCTPRPSRSSSATSARRPGRSQPSPRPTTSCSAQFRGGDEGRHQDRQRHTARRGDRQGQPVQSQPRRRGRQGADRARQGRPDAGRLDARDHQSRVHPVRDRGGAPASRPRRRGSPGSSASRPIPAAARRPGSPSTTSITTSGAWRT